MILALDVSLTSTGVVLLGDDFVPVGVTAIQPKCFGLDRYRFILQQLSVIIESYNAGPDPIRLVVFEGYPYFLFSHKHQASKNFNPGNQVFGLAGVTELIKMKVHFKYQLPFACIAPNSIKMFATGNGRAKKAEMIAALAAKMGLRYRTDDEVDACWLALMSGLIYYGRKGIGPPPLVMDLLNEPQARKALLGVLEGGNPEGTYDWKCGMVKANLWNRKGG